MVNDLPLHAELYIQAPGRVNLLGEHVDYNDGPVLPAAIDRAVHLAVNRSHSSQVRLHALDLDQRVAFHLDQVEKRLDVNGAPLPSWALYPAGVAWSLQAAGFALNGMEAAYTSTIPIGAGLSSSAAVEVAFAVAWQALDPGGPLSSATRMDLARLCQQAENYYVGVNSGLMDQFASAHGIEGHAVYFDTRSLEYHPVPLPAGTVLVIADSGVRRSLTGSAYNDRRAACETAVAMLREHLPGIRALRDVTPEQFASCADTLPEIVRKRARHVVEECARVDQAVRLLAEGDGPGFGQLMFATHASLRDLYEVSTRELDHLVEIAGRLPGCLGARLTGAGFGGCTVNLVEDESGSAFIEGLQQGYRETTSQQAQVYLCRASQGASVMEGSG
jgi:galactokinase